MKKKILKFAKDCSAQVRAPAMNNSNAYPSSNPPNYFFFYLYISHKFQNSRQCPHLCYTQADRAEKDMDDDTDNKFNIGSFALDSSLTHSLTHSPPHAPPLTADIYSPGDSGVTRHLHNIFTPMQRHLARAQVMSLANKSTAYSRGAPKHRL